MAAAIINGALAAVWALVEPLLLYGLAAAAVAAFVAGIVFLLPAVRPWAVLAFLGSLAAGSGAGFLYGQKVAGRDAELAAARARIEAMERDVAVARAAEADAETKAEAQAAYAKSLETQVSEYEADLQREREAVPAQGSAVRPPDDRCALDARDVERLRRLDR